MEKLKELLEFARSNVIEPLQQQRVMTIEQLKVREAHVTEQLELLWNKEEETEKFGDDEIFGSPLEVAYLLYCYPIQLVAVIKEPEKLHEYWDFFLENYPTMKFDRNIDKFY